MPPNPQTPPAGSTRLVLIAVGLALVAVVLVNLYIEMVRRQVEQSSFNAYVLTRSMLPGDRLRKQDVKTLVVPKSFESTFRDLGAMDHDGLDIHLNEGRSLARSAAQNDILRFTHFTAPDGADLDRDIAKGKRLVSLPINSRTVPATLRPGMFVDIEAPFNVGGALPEVMTVLENVQVKAVGSRVMTSDDAGSERPRATGASHTISLEVDPQQATDLSMIQRLVVGDFEIHIRNPADKDAPKVRAGGINPDVLDLIEQRRMPLMTPGKRAVSLPVNTRALPGNIKPGVFVDIAGPFRSGESGTQVLTVIERVRVLAVLSRTEQSDSGRRTSGGSAAAPLGSSGVASITIEVGPDDANSLSMVKRVALGDFEVRIRDTSVDEPLTIRGGGINPVIVELIKQLKDAAPATGGNKR